MKTARHILLSALVFVGTLSLAPADASAYYSLLGGETLNVRDSALELQVGYPEVRLGYHIPIIENLEITPRLNLIYTGYGNFASGSAPWGGGRFGIRAGADIKYRFFNKKKFHLAIVAPIGVHLSFGDPVLGAIQLGIPGGIHMTWEANNSLNLVAGYKMPFAVDFKTEAFIVPFIFEVGVEYAINDNINISALVEAGPVVTTFKTGPVTFTSTTSWVAGFVGMQYRL